MMIFVAVLIAGVVEGGGGVPIRAPRTSAAQNERGKKAKIHVRAGQGGECSWRVR